MRLFIAILLNEDIEDLVTDVQETFRRLHVNGNYSPKENLHITLVFIGEYSDPDEVLEIMESVRFKPFKITADGIGCFDDVWWTGVEENENLENLVKQLRHALADAGIPFDRKGFKGHVTFLRKPDYSEERRIEALNIGSAEMTVKRISLMLSTSGKNGMIYTELGYVEAEEGKDCD